MEKSKHPIFPSAQVRVTPQLFSSNPLCPVSPVTDQVRTRLRISPPTDSRTHSISFVPHSHNSIKYERSNTHKATTTDSTSNQSSNFVTNHPHLAQPRISTISTSRSQLLAHNSQHFLSTPIEKRTLLRAVAPLGFSAEWKERKTRVVIRESSPTRNHQLVLWGSQKMPDTTSRATVRRISCSGA